MSKSERSTSISEAVVDDFASETSEPRFEVTAQTFDEKAQQVLQCALEAYSASLDWVVFFREILGIKGLVHRTFQGDELAAFQRVEEYARIQEMLVELRVRPKPEDQEVEPTRVITVRLPKRLHEALKAEAHKRATSMNQLCISKLVQLIDGKLVPKD